MPEFYFRACRESNKRQPVHAEVEYEEFRSGKRVWIYDFECSKHARKSVPSFQSLWLRYPITLPGNNDILHLHCCVATFWRHAIQARHTGVSSEELSIIMKRSWLRGDRRWTIMNTDSVKKSRRTLQRMLWLENAYWRCKCRILLRWWKRLATGNRWSFSIEGGGETSSVEHGFDSMNGGDLNEGLKDFSFGLFDVIRKWRVVDW